MNIAQALASQGRMGDSLVAHINPKEAMLLKAAGGKGSINPKTGLLEFYDIQSAKDEWIASYGNIASDFNPGGAFYNAYPQFAPAPTQAPAPVSAAPVAQQPAQTQSPAVTPVGQTPAQVSSQQTTQQQPVQPQSNTPSGWDAAAYLVANPDVAAAGVDPLQHWNQYGKNEGRSWTQASTPAPTQLPAPTVTSVQQQQAPVDQDAVDQWKAMYGDVASDFAPGGAFYNSQQANIQAAPSVPDWYRATPDTVHPGDNLPIGQQWADQINATRSEKPIFDIGVPQSYASGADADKLRAFGFEQGADGNWYQPNRIFAEGYKPQDSPYGYGEGSVEPGMTAVEYTQIKPEDYIKLIAPIQRTGNIDPDDPYTVPTIAGAAPVAGKEYDLDIGESGEGSIMIGDQEVGVRREGNQYSINLPEEELSKYRITAGPDGKYKLSEKPTAYNITWNMPGDIPMTVQDSSFLSPGNEYFGGYQSEAGEKVPWTRQPYKPEEMADWWQTVYPDYSLGDPVHYDPGKSNMLDKVAGNVMPLIPAVIAAIATWYAGGAGGPAVGAAMGAGMGAMNQGVVYPAMSGEDPSLSSVLVGAGTGAVGGGLGAAMQSGGALHGLSAGTKAAISGGVAAAGSKLSGADWEQALTQGLVSGAISYVGGKYFDKATGQEIEIPVDPNAGFDPSLYSPEAIQAGLEGLQASTTDLSYYDWLYNPDHYSPQAISEHNQALQDSTIMSQDEWMQAGDMTPEQIALHNQHLQNSTVLTQDDWRDLFGMTPQDIEDHLNALQLSTTDLSYDDWIRNNFPYDPKHYSQEAIDAQLEGLQLSTTDISPPTSWWDYIPDLTPYLPVARAIIGSGILGGGGGGGATPLPSGAPVPGGGVDGSGAGGFSSMGSADNSGYGTGGSGVNADLARISRILAAQAIKDRIAGYKGGYYTGQQ